MTDSRNNIVLFKAVVVGDLKFLKSLPSDTDWSKKFTFDKCDYCLCGIQIEKFNDTPEVMLSEFEETVRTGLCPHYKGGPKAPKNFQEKEVLMHYVLDHDLFPIEDYMNQTIGVLKLDLSGVNPLHLAVMLNHKQIVSWLLQDVGVDIHARTGRLKETPLNQAVFTDDKDMVELLLNLGANPNEIANNSCASAVKLAVENDNSEILNLLIQHGADINQFGPYDERPIYLAVSEGKTKCIEVLLNEGADTSFYPSQEVTVLDLAVQYHPDVVKMLLKGNVDVNECVNYSTLNHSLVTAIVEDKLDLTRLLLEHGADVNKRLQHDDRVLSKAACNNVPGAVDLLLQFGADVNHANEYKYTALHHAASNNYVGICQKLLAAGAECDSLTESKNTPLSLACLGNHIETIKLFLSQCDCNVNNQDTNLNTPLHYTTFNDNIEATELLMSKGANPAVENIARTTPLWNAIYRRNREFIKQLVDKNVPLDAPSSGTNHQAQTYVRGLPINRTLTHIYNHPKSLLYLAARKKLEKIPTMLVLAGVDLSKEMWLYKAEYPAILQVNNMGVEIIKELDKLARNVLSLKETARGQIRRMLGISASEIVPELEIPQCLVDYLMLKDW